MRPPHDCLARTRSRAAVWSNSRPTPRRQEKDLLRKQKLGILAAVRSTLRALHSRFGRAFLCLPGIAGAKRSSKGQHLAPLIFVPPAFGDGCAPGRWANRALVPLTLSLSAGLGITGRLHSEYIISTLPSV